MLRFTSNQQARMLAERVNVRSWGNYVGRSQSKGRYQATRFDLHYVHLRVPKMIEIAMIRRCRAVKLLTSVSVIYETFA